MDIPNYDAFPNESRANYRSTIDIFEICQMIEYSCLVFSECIHLCLFKSHYQIIEIYHYRDNPIENKNLKYRKY